MIIDNHLLSMCNDLMNNCGNKLIYLNGFRVSICKRCSQMIDNRNDERLLRFELQRRQHNKK